MGSLFAFFGAFNDITHAVPKVRSGRAELAYRTELSNSEFQLPWPRSSLKSALFSTMFVFIYVERFGHTSDQSNLKKGIKLSSTCSEFQAYFCP